MLGTKLGSNPMTSLAAFVAAGLGSTGQVIDQITRTTADGIVGRFKPEGSYANHVEMLTRHRRFRRATAAARAAKQARKVQRRRSIAKRYARQARNLNQRLYQHYAV